MPVRQHGNQRFGPFRAGVAARQFELSDDERAVQPVFAKLHHRIAARALGDFDLAAGVLRPILRNQPGEKAVRYQGMDADAQAAIFPSRGHTCCLHGMVELIDASSDALDEVASSLGQPNATSMTLELEDAKAFLQRLDARTDD